MSKMEHFVGKYKLVKTENVLEYLVSIGIPEDRAKDGVNTWPNIDVTVDGKTITMKSDQPANFSSTLILDEEVDEKLSNGRILQTTLKLDGGKLIASSTGPYNFCGNKTYEISGDELVVTLWSPRSSVAGLAGKKYYKKL